MARGGKRKGAGRKRGSKTKLTREIESRLGAEKPPQWAASAVKGTLAEIAAEYRPQALATLMWVCECDTAPAAARVMAANSLLDRSDGKPMQAVEHSGPGGGPIEHADVSDFEVARRIAFLLTMAAKNKQ